MSFQGRFTNVSQSSMNLPSLNELQMSYMEKYIIGLVGQALLSVFKTIVQNIKFSAYWTLL